MWRKAWLETRWRFLIGLGLFILLTMGTVMGYPMVARRLPSLQTLPETQDLVGRALRESLELSRTFRGYVWMNAFRQNLAQMGTLFAILLGSGGLRTERVGTLFTLSLPVSRRALTLSRAACGLAELFAMTMIPALMIPLMAPAIGERYALLDGIVHGVCLFVAATVFFSLTYWLSTTSSDVWRPLLFVCGIAILLAVIEAVLPWTAPFGLFHAMRGDSYFRTATVPWMGLAIAVAASGLFLHRALVVVERQDY
jgi:hypothetical protein